MKILTKLFVCEFITGGGFNHLALNGALVQEGMMMRDALLRDLSLLPYEIQMTVDARIDKPKACDTVSVIHKSDDIWAVWEQIIMTVDAVWVIAPETDGALERLTAIAIQHNKLVLGVDVATIKVTASNMLTYQAFKHTDVAVLPTVQLNDWAASEEKSWVIKPDDGVGCEAIFFLENTQHAKHWIAQHKELSHYVIQPYQHGVPASISCIFHEGEVQLLSCNKQIIGQGNDTFSFNGVIVNGMVDYWEALLKLANQVAQQLPGLEGYVGIDVMINQDSESNDNEAILLEINPRLTTSYIGLAEATGVNPAALVIDTLTNANVHRPILQRNPVLQKNRVQINVICDLMTE